MMNKKPHHPSNPITHSVREDRHAVYASDLVSDVAIILPFEWKCPVTGRVQPVFLVQKELSQSVREQERIDSPYVN